MRLRTRRQAVAAAVLVGAIAVSGCSFHPGQAAMVNDSSISQSSVDDLVKAGCGFFEASNAESGTGEPTSTAFLRNLFTQNLISFKIIDKAAAQMGLTVSDAVVAKNGAGQTIPSGLQGEDRERLQDFFTMSTRADLQQAVIGAHLKDPSVTNADDFQQSQLNDLIGQSTAYLKDFTLKQDVSVNPAYGTWREGALLDTDGSLSAAQSVAARKWLRLRAQNSTDATGLPPSQVCG